MQDITIDGQGSELIFKDSKTAGGIGGSYIYINNCTRVKVTNLILDWDWDSYPLAAIGKITDVNKNAKTIEYELDIDKDIPSTVKILQTCREWDPEINNRSPKGYHLNYSDIIRTEVIGPKKIRLHMKNLRNNPAEGQYTNIAFTPNARFNGIIVSNSNHITMDNVYVYGAPETGIYGEHPNNNLQIINSKVAPRPGTKRSKSALDAIRVTSANLILENNEIVLSHDDAMNVGTDSGHFLGGGLITKDDVAINDNRIIIADNLQQYQSFRFIYKGAKYSLYDSNFKPIGWSSEIESFEWQLNYHKGASAAHRCIIKFKDPIPNDVPQGAMLMMKSEEEGSYIIRNNTIRQGLCHGLYIGDSNGLIEGNYVSTAYPGIILNMVLRWERWFLKYFPENVIIRNNVIENSNTALRQPASLFIGGGYDNNDFVGYVPVKGIVAQNVLIENNTIKNSTWAPLGVWSAKNVLVLNNKIINPNTVESHSRYKGKGIIFVTDSEDIIIAGNQCSYDDLPKESGIYIDSETTKNIILDANEGFDVRK